MSSPLSALSCVVLLSGCGALGELRPAPQASASPETPSPSPTASPSASPTASATPSPTPLAFGDLVEQVRTGVVRFAVTDCESGGGAGSGFLVSPRLVATVAHVVEGGSVIRVVQGTTSTAARVIGVDAPADVALVETMAPLAGHEFTFADEQPRIGDDLAVLGFPRGGPLSVTRGTVNGLDRKRVIDGVARHSLIEHDAASTGGSSGGPVIDGTGQVLGLHDAGPQDGEGGNLAVSGLLARRFIETWQDEPQDVPPVHCEQVNGPQGAELPQGGLDDETRRQVGSTLEVYFGAINNGDFATAFAQRAEPRGTFEAFKEAVRSSQDSDFEVQGARRSGNEVVIGLDFTSRQEPGAGPRERPDETCTRWALDYTLRPSHGLWLIAGSAARPGQPRSTPCATTGATPSPTRGATDAPSDGPGDDPTDGPSDSPTGGPSATARGTGDG